MAKRKQRPIDVKDMPYSYLGKDALDEAAEHLWNNVLRGPDKPPYHLLTYAIDGTDQEILQQSVLDVLGHSLPKMIRARVKAIKADGGSADDVYYLIDLAEELEEEHGV